jgi:hypothetical protein
MPTSLQDIIASNGQNLNQQNRQERDKAAGLLWHQGYNLIPLSGKNPPLIKWKEDYRFDTQRVTKEQLQQWANQFAHLPILNWGLLCGSIIYSDAWGIIVAEADNEAGDEMIQRYCPATPLTQQSGNRSKHYGFRAPPGIIIPNRQGTTIDGVDYKVDIRGDGGYICAPGSTHPKTGRLYQWEQPWTAELIASAPIYDPTWIPHMEPRATIIPMPINLTDVVWDESADDIAIPMEERARQFAHYARSVPGTVEGDRNNETTVLLLARKGVKGFALSEESAVDLLFDWGQRSDQQYQDGSWYPWTFAQIKHKVRDASKAEYEGTIGDCLNKKEYEAILTAQREQMIDGLYMESTVRQPKPIEEWEDPNDVCEVKSKATSPTADATTDYRFEPLTSAQFATTDYKMEWLIRGMMVKGQPTIVGGPKKAMKTNILTDMVISLGSGKPFLGAFEVRTTSTCFISGESGGYTLQETARRICKAKGITLADVDCWWDFRLPKLSVAEELVELSRGLAKRKIETVVIDPLYLCLLAGSDKSASNLYDMGPLLLDISKACMDAGAHPMMAHHAKKNLLNTTEPMDLEDLSFSGVQEFARQWLLISRRIPYEAGSGVHDLWLTSGGSVGHGGLWAVRIDEGVLQDDFSGRKWECEVRDKATAKAEANERKATAKASQWNESEQELLAALDRETTPPSRNKLRVLLGWNHEKVAKVVNRLIATKTLVLTEGSVITGKGATRPIEVIARA